MAVPKAHGTDEWGEFWWSDIKNPGYGKKWRGVKESAGGGHTAYTFTDAAGKDRVEGSGFVFEEMPAPTAPAPPPAPPAPAAAPAAPTPQQTTAVARGTTDSLNASPGTTGAAWMGNAPTGGRNRNSLAALRSRVY